MKAKELQELLDFIAKSGLNKVNIETEEFKISVQRDPTTKHVMSAAAPAAALSPAPALKVLSMVRPVLMLRILVRTKAGPLPGFTC